MDIVDLNFPIAGDSVPRDHGYALYGALSRALPEVHGARWLAVHPLSGRPNEKGRLHLVPSGSLRLRLPTDRIATVLALPGQTLDVAGAHVTVGAPTVHRLVSAASLDARLVVVKLTDVPTHDHATLGRRSLDRPAIEERVRQELCRQLEKLDIGARPELRGHGRIMVGGRAVVGFTVRVQGLSADDSLRLQINGLGGKRRMGCGVFRPTRGA